MKREITRRAIAVGAFSALALVLSACSSADPAAPDPGQVGLGDLPVSERHGSFSIDVDDPATTVGDADYVFIGYVDSLEGTTYKHRVTLETADGSREVSSPYTDFQVTVIENIKGELVTDTSLPVQKSGGVSEDGSSLVLYEDDVLPEVGFTYVFLAYGQRDDGSLLVSGPNSSPAIENAGADLLESPEKRAELDDDKIVRLYRTAAENAVESDRERFKSEFDSSN